MWSYYKPEQSYWVSYISATWLILNGEVWYILFKEADLFLSEVKQVN